jgi:hypothetical protein
LGGPRIGILILPGELITAAQRVELDRDDGLEYPTSVCDESMIFRETAKEQIDIIDAAELRLPIGCHGQIAG